MKRHILPLLLAAALWCSVITGAAPGPEKIPMEKAITQAEAAQTQLPATAENPYAAPLKTPEVYDPADTRKLKVLGAAASDGDWCVLYGECAVGAVVRVKNTLGTFEGTSDGGCFALRFRTPDPDKADLTVSQWVNRRQVGYGKRWQGTIVKQDKASAWGVRIGYENQGFFEKMIPDFTRTNRLDEATLNKVQARYADRVKKLQAVGDGCELVMVLAPSSMTVYPERVPEEVAKPGTGDSRLDQVKTALTKAGVTVIDLRETYAERKNDSLPLYFHYDSHWTDYGAYLAYVELYKHIAEDFPEAMPRTFDEFTWERSYHTRGDITWYFGLDKGGTVYEHTVLRRMNFTPVKEVQNLVRYPDETWSLSYPCYSKEVTGGGTYHTGRSALPDIMVIRNSYGAYLYDLLVERSDSAYMLPSFQYAFNLAQIKKNEPDYLIYILCEWELGNIIDN